MKNKKEFYNRTYQEILGRATWDESRSEWEAKLLQRELVINNVLTHRLGICAPSGDLVPRFDWYRWELLKKTHRYESKQVIVDIRVEFGKRVNLAKVLVELMKGDLIMSDP